MGRESEALPSILRLKPLEYAHITNENTNTTSLVVGPQNRVIASNEVVTHPATAFHIIPPNHYCRIRNPYKHCWNPATSAEEPVLDVYGQVQVDAGGVEVRHHCTPFPLYPEEQLDGPIAPLPVLRQEESLLIEVLTAYKMEHPSNPPSGSTTTATVREEGERYVVKGPGAYIPRVEEVILERRRMSVVPTDHGLHCCAQREYKDVDGVLRASTEDYLLLQVGSYHPLPYETVIGVVAPISLNPRQGLHVEVKTSYIDPRPFAKGTERRAGDRFLVTSADTSAFIPHPYDVVVKEVSRVDLGPDEYCIVTASTGNKDPKRAMTEMRSVRTHTSFFLLPEEVLATPPTPVYLLSEDQAILLEVIEDFSDGDQHRHRGDRWLLKGPSRYIPVSSVVVVPDDRSGKEVREAALLCDGQGIYVRHRQTGEVRCITGPTRYMLEAYEELWQKPLPPNVERRLRGQASHAAYLQAANRGTEELRGCTAQAVSYQIPHRCVTLLYNYKSQSTRTVFGPNRVVLEPDESFTVVSLSGSPWDAENPTKCLPKEPNRIQSLSLFLGPSNMSDVVTVETRDHAQLALQLCYDWYFDIEYGNAEAAKECFTVNDFVGNACSFIASRIRAAVASMPFEEFHKRSAECLTQAVFGINPTTGEPEKELRFPTNHLVISSVDTQEMEVLDPRTRQGLLKSVKVAIEITTHAQEALAQQVASTRDQESHGLLERQRMKDQTTNEEQRRKLLEVQSRGLTIVNSGKSTAFAEAMSTAAEIEGNATVDAVRLRSEKEQLLAEVVTSMERQKKTLELAHEAALSDAAHALQRQLEEIQHSKFARMVEALGQSTIAEIARAGPELQANLLQSLGLEGFLVTDGSSPLNLYQTAEGLVATPASASASAGAPTASPS